MAAPTITPFFFDPAHLLSLAEANAEAYRTAEPFPNIALDDFVPADVVSACVAEFPRQASDWDVYLDRGNSNKLATSDETLMGPVTRHLIAQFNSAAVIRFLERLTGIEGLVPDPHLWGGGLHQLEPGGFLRIHADFNRHEALKLDRRINLLVYLNEDWKDEYGGHLEFWSRDMSRKVKSIAPLAGRIAIFNTTSDAYHGNPEPVACPEGMARRSLAFYYYTNGRPEEERTEAHNTLYMTPGQAPGAPGAEARERDLRALARDLTPPIVARGVRRLRARRTR